MLRHTASQNNHTGLLGPHSHLIDLPDILDDIKHQIILVGVGKEHVADSTVCDGWAEHWDVVLVTPVVDAVGVVDFFAKSSDHFAWRPDNLLLDLFFSHFGENWQ